MSRKSITTKIMRWIGYVPIQEVETAEMWCRIAEKKASLAAESRDQMERDLFWSIGRRRITYGDVTYQLVEEAKP